jgi:putative SOS response-associated peptidase YedK
MSGAEAPDETKRLALIELLIEERARDKLAAQRGSRAKLFDDLELFRMCDLYSITTNEQRSFPDYPAPVVRNTGAERELTMMRWGVPPTPKFGGAPVTNIRNTVSPHWRGWLKTENRRLVPFNSFSEYAPQANPATGKKDVVWFALNDDRPLCAFAGIWTEFKATEAQSPNQFWARTTSMAS